jgi:aliphatic nitrilase
VTNKDVLTSPLRKVAAVQTAPVFLDTPATVEKACRLIREAAGNGAQLVAFPEVFISAYPYWNWLLNPIEGSEWFKRLYESAVTIDSEEVVKLRGVVAECGCTVVIGMNETCANSPGTIYNANLVIGPTGDVLGRHRKLVPTWAEKLTWSGGDGSSLRTYKTPVGQLGTLACGENTNTLARFALLAQGENIHVANYIALPVAPTNYDMAEAIRIRATAHSFEGKLHTVVACSLVDDAIIDAMEKARPGSADLLARKRSSFSGIIDPHGNLIGEPLIDEEGIVYGDIDLSAQIELKQMHDITGGYNRFDIFELTVNRKPQPAALFTDLLPAGAGQQGDDREPEDE